MEGWQDWAPIVVSSIAVCLTVVGLTLGRAKQRRDGLWQYLNLLASDAVVASRDVVGAAARTTPDRGGNVHGPIMYAPHRELSAKYRQPIFQMLWVVQLARPVLFRNAKPSKSPGLEFNEICSHLDLVLPDLSEALAIWGRDYQAEESVSRVNSALAELRSRYGTALEPYENLNRITLRNGPRGRGGA